LWRALGACMGQAKPADYYVEAVKKFIREHQEYIAESDDHQWPRNPGREPKPTLARLVGIISVAKIVQYGLIAAFVSVVIVGLLSLRVH
jgi:hypothetical protein